MVRVPRAAGWVPAVVAWLTAATPAAAQFVSSNTPIQSITLQQSGGDPTLTVGGTTLFSATAHLLDGNGNPTTRVLGGGGGAFWNISWSPAISVAVCNPQASIFSTQNIPIDSGGVFHQVWSPTQPNTLKADGLMTMPTATSNATLTAALACFSGAPTGSMSASWSGTHYDGTYTFNGSDGVIVLYGLRFSSDMPAVATVDNRGVVGGVSEGDATITAYFGSLCWQMLPGASQCYGETSASVSVHVNPAPGGGGGGGGGDDGPPLTAGPDQTLQCSSHAGAAATMQGAIFFVPQSPLTYVWTGPFGNAMGLTPTVNIPLGSHDVTFTISDGTRSASDSATITVVDTQPPVISSATPNPSALWAPNHQMRPVSLSVSAADVCDPSLDCRIVEVTGNDGATAADWEIAGPLSLKLRATRSGGAAGRTYVVTLECRDASGNTARRTVDITVPHDQR
jgi:hypothetical protein